MEARFKGGQVWLNSGGQGPDDYLLKPIRGGRWTYVIFRFGRNFGWSPEGKIEDLEIAQENAKADHAIMGNIFPVQRICVPDNANRYRKMKAKGNVLTMNAAEFWETYKDFPLLKVNPCWR